MSSERDDLEELVRDLADAKRRVRIQQEAVNSAKLALAQRRKDLADAIRAKDEIEDELTDPGLRRPLLAAAARNNGSSADEHQRGVTEAPAKSPKTKPKAARADRREKPAASNPGETSHFEVRSRDATGIKLGTQIAVDRAEATRLAAEGFGGPLWIGESHPHGPDCGCATNIVEAEVADICGLHDWRDTPLLPKIIRAASAETKAELKRMGIKTLGHLDKAIPPGGNLVDEFHDKLGRAEALGLCHDLDVWAHQRGWTEPYRQGKPYDGFPLSKISGFDTITMAAARSLPEEDEPEPDENARWTITEAGEDADAPEPPREWTSGDIDRELERAVRRPFLGEQSETDVWATFERLGAITDVQIAEVLRNVWGRGFTYHPPTPEHRFGRTIHGWPTPMFWIGKRRPEILHTPHLRDKPLIDRVRAVLKLPRVPAATAMVAAQIKATQSAADKRRVRKAVAKPKPAEVRP